jgi:pyruvate dehydrogenase E1 component
VIAVTGYTQPIAEQIAPFVSARFIALGANPQSRRGETDSFGAQWIVAKALKALVEDKVLPVQTLEAALRAYALR